MAIYFYSLLFFIFNSKVFSFDESAAEPFQEFEIGIGAKAKSLGGSFVSISDDPTAVYWNPAGLSQIKTIQIMLMGQSNNPELGVKDEFVGIVLPAKDLTIGTGYWQKDAGSIDVYDAWGTFLYSYSTYSSLYFLSLSKEIRKDLYSGLSLKYYKAKLFTEEGTLHALETDIGLIYRVNLPQQMINNLQIGALIQNIRGSYVKSETGNKDKISRNIKIGVAAQILNGRLTLTCEADQKTGFHYGAEYLLVESIPLRIGKDAYGVGFKTKNYEIDYCYIRKEILGNPQRISITLLN